MAHPTWGDEPLSRRDPAAAGKWVEDFPGDDLRTRAVDELDGIARSLRESKR